MKNEIGPRLVNPADDDEPENWASTRITLLASTGEMLSSETTSLA